MPIVFLRPGWFMENSRWDVAAARENGVIPGFLQPLDKPVPMVATADVGRVAAGSAPGNLERLKSRRVGRAAPGDARRDCGHLR